MATALLVIDVQGDFCHKNAPAYVNGAAAALPKVRQAIDSARKSGVPVIWVVREHDASGKAQCPRRATVPMPPPSSAEDARVG